MVGLSVFLHFNRFYKGSIYKTLVTRCKILYKTCRTMQFRLISGQSVLCFATNDLHFLTFF